MTCDTGRPYREGPCGICPARAAVLLAILIGVFLTLTWLSARDITCQVDELTDIHIANMIRADPLFGCGLDGSQARLPMYTTAAVFSVAGWVLPAESINQLLLARATSLAVGALTILLLYLVAKRCIGRLAALVACGVLAFSPYYCGLVRTAMTEGDAYCPAAVLFVLWTFLRYRENRSSTRLVMLAVAGGFAVATKFYLVAIMPPLMALDWFEQAVAWRRGPDAGAGAAAGADECDLAPAQPVGWRFLVWALATVTLLSISVALTQAAPITDDVGMRSPLRWAVLVWGTGFLSLVVGMAAIVVKGRGGAGETGDVPPSNGVWAAVSPWCAIGLLTGAVGLAFPEHALHQDIAGTFLGRVFGWDESTPGGGLPTAVRLYGGLVLLKMGPPLGVAMLAALGWAAVRAFVEPRLRPIVLVLAMYFFMLAALPVQQYFYLMSIYPLLALVLAGLIMRLVWSVRAQRLRWGWAVAAVCAIGWLVVGYARVYPTYPYYGYELIGDRWLGSESRGYRDVIQVTNDGSHDALQWCAANVRTDEHVYSYLRDHWVVESLIGSIGAPYELTQQDPKAPWAKVEPVPQADYLMVALQNVVTYRDAPPIEAIAEHYDPEPAHVVWRGRGVYRLPVVTIYRARPSRRGATVDSIHPQN